MERIHFIWFNFLFFFSKITSKFAIFFLVTDCCGSFLHVEHRHSKPLVKSAAIFIYIIYTCSHGYIQKYMNLKKKKAEALHTTKALKAQCTFFLVHRVYIILLTGQCDPNVIPNRHIRAFLKWFRGKTRLWLTKYNLENMLKLNVGLHCNV